MLGIRFIAGYFPDQVESFYSQGIFKAIRIAMDKSITNIPIPLWSIFAVVLIFWLIRQGIKSSRKTLPVQQRLLNFLFSILAFVGGTVGLFLFLWGFNYARPSIKDHIGIVFSKPRKADLKLELELETKALIADRNLIESIEFKDYKSMKQLAKKNLIDVFDDYEFPHFGDPNLKLNQPHGWLLRWSTAGFYFPWAGDCNVAPGLLDMQLPFVMSHEYAHAYGVTNEGECNFLAYLASLKAENPFIRYSGRFAYWQFLRKNYRRNFGDEEYKKFFNDLPEKIQEDVIAVYENGLKYPDILPNLRYATYDLFLKSQGVKEGNASYSEIIELVIAWKKKTQYY